MGLLDRIRSKSAKKKARKAALKADPRYPDIVCSRRGSNTLYGNGDGDVIQKKVPTKWVTDKRGNKFEIPVDKDGHVPRDAIVARFLNVNAGSRDGHPRNIKIDLMKDAAIYAPQDGKGFTPEEIMQIGWWQHPNSCDIEGVDDIQGGAALMCPIAGVPRSAMNVGNRIAIMNMSENEAARARGILARNFTGTELKAAVKNGGIIITQGNPGRNCSGCHYGRQPDVDTPVIILEPGYSEETLTHEFTHHLRQADRSRGGLAATPFPLDERGYLKTPFFMTKESKSAHNLEEAATVSESYIRSGKVEGPNGYYQHIRNNRSVDERFKHDRALYAGADGSGVCRGRRAVRALERNFDDSDVSHLNYAGGQNAARYYSTREANGTLPVAEPRYPRHTGKKALPPPSSTAARQVATANRRGRY